MELVTRNWKTTLCGGVSVIALALKPILDPKYHELLNAVSVVAGSLGLVFAADSPK